MQALLSFDQAPPLAAPLRFFLTAPLFAILAALLVLWSGPELFASRWTGAALALTHLITVGFMLQVMLGAMLQILPVVAGANISRPAAGRHPGARSDRSGRAASGDRLSELPAAAVLAGRAFYRRRCCAVHRRRWARLVWCACDQPDHSRPAVVLARLDRDGLPRRPAGRWHSTDRWPASAAADDRSISVGASSAGALSCWLPSLSWWYRCSR
jgi:hypothetical protein